MNMLMKANENCSSGVLSETHSFFKRTSLDFKVLIFSDKTTFTLCNAQPLSKATSVLAEPKSISAKERPPEIDWQPK